MVISNALPLEAAHPVKLREGWVKYLSALRLNSGRPNPLIYFYGSPLRGLGG